MQCACIYTCIHKTKQTKQKTTATTKKKQPHKDVVSIVKEKKKEFVCDFWKSDIIATYVLECQKGKGQGRRELKFSPFVKVY